MKNTNITFLVSTTNPGTELGFEAWLDHQKVLDINHVQQSIDVSIPVAEDEAQHVLELVLKGKQSAHTVINDAGEIVSDAVLEISNLAFDDIPLGQIVNEKTSYTHNFNGTGTTSQHDFFGVMGCNGTVELKFTTPVYLWLLENM